MDAGGFGLVLAALGWAAGALALGVAAALLVTLFARQALGVRVPMFPWDREGS